MTRTFLGTFALVFAAMLGLYAFDTFLARTEQMESHAEGERLFREGQALLARHDAANAIERFRSALQFDRNNPGYQLALAQALLTDGKLNECEDVTRRLLERAPTSGSANLTMARVLVKQARIADAESYYHRAIYGKWPENDAAAQRLQVRLELIDLLARQRDKQALLAELLPLQDAKLDLDTRERIAHLYQVAGSPARAMDMYKQILHEQPSNAGAFAGLGAAEFARGNYRGAHLDFLIASRLDPGNSQIKAQLALTSEVLALDPTLRGVNQHGRYERSVRLVQLAKDSLGRCLGASAPQPLIDAANAALSARVNPAQESDATDSNLDLAEKLWQSRNRECRQPVSGDEQALQLVLSKIAQ